MIRWSYRGQSLDELGIVTLVSDALKMPERRGQNLVIPMRHGRIHVAKLYEQRSFALGLEVVRDSVEALEEAVDDIKRLLGRPGLGELAQTLEDLSVRTIWAEYTGDLGLKRVSPVSVRLLLEFDCPDPFFRSSTLISDAQTVDVSPKEYTLNNPGTADQENPKLILAGPLNNVIITNNTNGVSLNYAATIEAGSTVTIEQGSNGEYTAVDELAANMIGNVSHSGSTALMALDAGDNDMSITDDDAAGGTVTVEFYPPWL